MLRAILSNRLSTNNEAKENRTLHKTPSKKALNKTIGSNKSGKKLNKFNSDLNSLNIISDDKELLKQSNLKTPLKISQQRAPLSNIKKANIKEKTVKNLNNQIRKTPLSLKKKSFSHQHSSASSSPTKKNNKFHNENENETPKHHGTNLKRQNSLSHLSPSTLTPFNHSLKKSYSFEHGSHEISKDNIFLTYMKNNTMNDKNVNEDDDIEYMPPSLSHLEEEIEPKYKINYEDLLHFKSPTVVDSDIFKRVNEEIDIELDSEANALKTKNFEFVDDFIINTSSSSKKSQDKVDKEKANETKKSQSTPDETLDTKKKKEKNKAIQEKLSQDFNLSFEEASDDEEIKLPDFLTTDDKDSLYFDEIHL